MDGIFAIAATWSHKSTQTQVHLALMFLLRLHVTPTKKQFRVVSIISFHLWQRNAKTFGRKLDRRFRLSAFRLSVFLSVSPSVRSDYFLGVVFVFCLLRRTG